MTNRGLATSTSLVAERDPSLLAGRGADVQLASAPADPNRPRAMTTRDTMTSDIDSWRYYNTLGEVHYPFILGGNMAGRVNLRLAMRDDTGDWVAAKGNGAVMRECRAALWSFEPGASEVFRKGWINIGVAGRGFLVRNKTADGDWSFELLSNFELVGKNTDAANPSWSRKKSAVRQELEDLPASSTVYDVWRPHAQFSDDADAALTAAHHECYELETLKSSMLARVLNRLVSLGILFLPNNLSLEQADGPATGASIAKTFQDLFTTNITQRGSSAAAVPIVLSGAPDTGEKIKHILLDTDFTEVEERYRQELRMTIAQTIELPVQTQTGDASTTNHWGMWSISESAMVNHVAPTCQMLAWEMTTQGLWPWLEAQGITRSDARKYCFAADITDASLAAVRTEGATQLYDRGELSGEALRRAFGRTEADAPTPDELLRWLGVKLVNPMLATWNIPGIDPAALLDATSPPGPGGFNADEPPASPENVPGSPDRGLDQS